MLLKTLKESFILHQEKSLSHRYICSDHINPLINKLSKKFTIGIIGESVNGEDIFSIQYGFGKNKILFWSQMHGNESTTTKALFDLLNTLQADNEISKSIESTCQITIIPILNPDGARSYTRVNANAVDLNRDAQDLSQPESITLRRLYDSFKPDYCFNLHGQRTIFGVGKTNKPATVSFLSPAVDENRTVTSNRLRAMELITVLNDNLQVQIPGQVGIYDDSFNANCVGDTFQSLGTPTILFEAGHYADDYARDKTREFIYQSLLLSLDFIGRQQTVDNGEEKYFAIPENEKSFFDIIIRNVKSVDDTVQDIGIQFQETLIDKTINFIPKIENLGNLSNFYAHREVNANSGVVLTHKGEPIYKGFENDFVLINNELFSLKLKKS
ncbi:peptidase M14 [Hanstruepera neustonica]|uniref:Peptidase M14 n=1 Tax=Hanstruepera neustonica TaxID=1445657 RepID=A0A2K1DYB3_9FLAO|nr:M14 metallopeptidase family protein [Hanstruepera neustonica]PNQ73013.1 peptidase M14 [Hanstruepera neustonica]